MDPIQLPVTPAILQIEVGGPTVHDPVNHDDIANAQIHFARVVKRRLALDPSVTNEHIVAARRFANQIDRAVNPMDEAPLWFQVYEAQARNESLIRHNELTVRHNELTVRHNELTVRLNNLDNSLAATYNRMSQRSHEPIKPLLGVNGEIPPNFPATREALFLLTQAQCTILLGAYNLNDGGTIVVKRNRLAAHIGLIL